MRIPELELEIVVASRERAERLTKADPQSWCVISIHGQKEAPAHLPFAREVTTLVFDDVIRDEPWRDLIAPREAHALAILDSFRQYQGHPLLIHCAMGISRSAAVALGALYWHALRKTVHQPVERVFEWLRQLGEFSPNARLARLLIEAIEPNLHRPFDQFCHHPQWHLKPGDDLYSRFYPKPKK